MSAEQDKPKLELPEGLASRLREFEGRLRAVETLAAVLGGLCGLLLGFALVFASDRFWDTPLWLRLAVLAGFVAAAAWGSSRWMRNWLWHRRDARALARLVQRHYPRLGDRLLGAVELAGEGENRNFSPALRRAAIQQVATEAEKYDFKKAVETRRTRRWLVAGAVLLGLVAAAFVLAPDAGRNALRRLLNPLSDTPRYTFVSIEAIPGELVVAHGEKFTLACRLAASTVWKPVQASCQVGNQMQVVAEIRGGAARFEVPGQTRQETMRLRIGDVSRSIRIIPMRRPELKSVAANVSLPDYLLLKPRQQEAELGRMKLLAGSTVAFCGTADRLLASASAKNGVDLKTSLKGARFTTAACAVEKLAPKMPEPGVVEFSWTDRYGLACAAPYKLEVQVEADAEPSLRCEGIAGAVAILADEVVEFKAAGADDYGLKKLWVEWWMEKNDARGLPEIRYSTPLGACGPDKAAAEGTYRFAPSILGLPEDVTVSMQASVVDYFPGRKPVQSPVYRVVILSRAEHAKLLQQQLQGILARLDEASREQERLLQSEMELAAQKAAELTNERTTEALKSDERAERATAQRMEELAKELGDLAKEALRNKDVPDKLLQEWAKLAAEMKQLAGGQMQAASQEMAQAQAQGEEQPRREDIEKAVEEMRQALEAMRQMQKKGDKSSQNMAARNFVNRLKAVAKTEGGIAANLKKVLPATAGMLPEELPAPVKVEFVRMHDDQKAGRTEAQHIRDDLAGFFNRTQEAKYDEVRQAMTEPDVLEAQKALDTKLLGNLAAVSIPDALALEKKFNDWAAMLDQQEEGEGGEGQGQGQQDNTDPALIFGLMRARVQEESLREETRALEERKASAKPEEHGKLAGALAAKQDTLSKDVVKLKEKSKGDPKIDKFLDQISGVMDETTGLLRKPETGSETVAAQTVVVEAIAKALEGSKKKGGKQQQQAMQKMMEMMGMMPGGQPGQGQEGAGGKAGSYTGAGGGDGEAGSVKKGAGVTTGLPEEYRDAIEAFFNASEEKGK